MRKLFLVSAAALLCATAPAMAQKAGGHHNTNQHSGSKHDGQKDGSKHGGGQHGGGQNGGGQNGGGKHGGGHNGGGQNHGGQGIGQEIREIARDRSLSQEDRKEAMERIREDRHDSDQMRKDSKGDSPQ